MSRLTRDQHFWVKIQTTNTIQSIALDKGKKVTFRQLYIYGAKDYSTGGALTANDADCYVGLDGDGPKVATDLLPLGDITPRKFIIPDSLPEMRLEDVWIRGTAGDGAWVSYMTASPP